MSVKKQLKVDLCYVQKIQYAEILQDHTIVLVSEAMLGSMALANVSAKQHTVCIFGYILHFCSRQYMQKWRRMLSYLLCC